MYPGPICLSWMVFTMPFLVDSVQPAACWCSLYHVYVYLGCKFQYTCEVVWGGSCTRFGVLPACLSEQAETSAVLPLQALHANIM